jgi:hypothetical protein
MMNAYLNNSQQPQKRKLTSRIQQPLMQEEGLSHLDDAGNRSSLIVTSVDERAMKRSSNGFVEMIQRAQ